MPFEQAVIEVASLHSIMCREQKDAFAIILTGGYRGAAGPEKDNKEGYYWHYHPTRNHTGYESVHIWFYGDAITFGFMRCK